MKSQELFPESLRVHDDENPLIYTNSIKVAVHFKHSHRVVLRCIETLINDMNETGMRWPQLFRPVHRIGRQGRDTLEYLMTRDGFSFLAMRLTSQVALQWKVLFIQTYQHMRNTRLH